MATEVILMQGVKAGGDRQELHEAIREHSMVAGRRVKEEGVANDLMDRIAADPLFASVRDQLKDLIDPMRFIGRSSEQVDEFMDEVIRPIFQKHQDKLAIKILDTVNV